MLLLRRLLAAQVVQNSVARGKAWYSPVKLREGLSFTKVLPRTMTSTRLGICLGNVLWVSIEAVILIGMSNLSRSQK